MTYQLTNYRNMAQGAIAAYYATPPYSQQRIPQRYRTSAPTRTITTTKRRRLTNKNSFRNQMLKNTPAKHNTQGPTTAMTANTIYTFNATSLITQGDANTNRDGDAINLEALKVRGYYSTSATAGAYMFRMIVGYSGEEITTGNAFIALGLTAGQIFLPNFPSNFVAVVNPKAFTVVHDEVIDSNSQIAATKDVANIAKTLLLKKKFLYQETASIFGKDTNLYIIVIAHVVDGATGTTPAGDVLIATDLIFK